jgi:glycosyltransferase involved in cell wall biosynthesis
MAPKRIVSVIASLTAGGIGPVCRYAAEGMARQTGWEITLLCLHDPPGTSIDQDSGLRIVCLGLEENCARLFLDWLTAYPQDLIITSDVSRIESAFPYIPRETAHVLQIHDNLRRYRAVAVRNCLWVDGVVCVARNIETLLRENLNEVGFRGLLDTVHNGAAFPPAPMRAPHSGPLRLLFMGRMDSFKGILDLAPILERLVKMAVPVRLTIVGGRHDLLEGRLKRKKLDHLVTWTGRVPHEECYQLAAEHDIFMMLSRKEPFGMVTIEAMSMGCVPIAYNVPSGSTEIIEHGKSGLLVPLGDTHAWAQQICNLHHDRKRLAELSNQAVEHSRGTFSAEAMSSNLASFLGEVLTHAKPHPARRESGLPPETPAAFTHPARGYLKLSRSVREWIRNRVGANPRLCYWLLNR